MALVLYDPPSNPGYDIWGQTNGYWTLLGSQYTQAKLESQNNSNYREDTIYVSYATATPLNNSLIYVRAMAEEAALEDGYVWLRVRLRKPDMTYVTLYEHEGPLAWQNIINGMDITQYHQQTGFYVCTFDAKVRSGYEVGPGYQHSYVIFETVTWKLDYDPPAQVTGVAVVALSKTKLHVTWNAVQRADTYNVKYKRAADPTYTTITGVTDLYKDLTGLDACTSYNVKVSASNESGEGDDSSVATKRTCCEYEKIFSETLGLSENFDTTRMFVKGFEESLDLVEDFSADKVYLVVKEFSEPLDLVETFSVTRLSPFDSKATKILAGCDDLDVKEFVPGSELGWYDTDDLDFGRPGQDKILDLIEFVSQAPAPHTLEVLVSTDSGTTWTSLGQDVTYKGKNAIVSPWITAEKFRIRFRGAGPYLQSVYATAIPVGGELDDD